MANFLGRVLRAGRDLTLATFGGGLVEDALLGPGRKAERAARRLRREEERRRKEQMQRQERSAAALADITNFRRRQALARAGLTSLRGTSLTGRSTIGG